jgi:O-antigen/teichoic acid export membrane protein
MFLIAKRFYDNAGLNPSVIFNILTRVVQSAAGIMVLLLITRFLTKNEQGYYYTFTSLLALQVLFELGITNIVTQYVAHEAAHLTWKNKHELAGEEYYKSRLAYTVQFSIKWFLFVAIILFAVLYFSGKLFFSTYNSGLNVDWEFPWLVLSVSTAFLLFVNLLLAILEGLGKIEEVNKLRLLQQLQNLFLITFFFFINLKLLSAGLAFLLSNIITGSILLAGYWRVIFNIWKTEINFKIDFKKEVLPYLIRIGLGSISGYFIWQIINPVLFATQGPVIAGQMGATQTFLNGILVVSLSWFSTKVAIFSNLVSRRRFNQLNVIYRKNLNISLVVCTIGLTTFTVFIYILKIYFPVLGNRFLDIMPIIFLGLAQLVSLIGNSQAYYLRSFKQEPFFIPSLVMGILSGFFTVVCSKYYGITIMSLVYFLLNGVIGLIWVCIIFRNKTFEWTKKRLYI